MTRISGLIALIAALTGQAAYGDEIRHLAIAATLFGTWASSAQNCDAKDKANFVIAGSEYGHANTSCAVEWVVETAGTSGPNYSVHAACTDLSQPSVKHVENLIMRPDAPGKITIGTTFSDQQPYQRCADAR